MTDVQIKDTQQIIALCNILSLFLIMKIIESTKTNDMPVSKADNIEMSESTLNDWHLVVFCMCDLRNEYVFFWRTNQAFKTFQFFKSRGLRKEFRPVCSREIMLRKVRWNCKYSDGLLSFPWNRKQMEYEGCYLHLMCWGAGPYNDTQKLY